MIETCFKLNKNNNNTLAWLQDYIYIYIYIYVYIIHSPTGIKHIFRLRLGLSHLKCLHLHDCRADPEGSFHFFLRCNCLPTTDNLLNDVQIMLRKYDLINLLDNLDVYLYGHQS